MTATNGHTAPTDTPAAYTDFAHTGPGTLAGRYLRRFWQPIYHSSDLAAGWTKPVQVMSERYTLYRGESGTPYLVAERCAHRGTQLSTGWVEGDCLRCFYHGWKYDGAGQCVEQPAEDASFAAKVRIASYPIEERLGCIFAYLGDAERDDSGAFRPPPFPDLGDFASKTLLEVGGYTWPCNYFNNVENGPDEAHVCFVHRESTLAVIADVPAITAEETEYGLMQYGTRANSVVRDTPFLMPNILYFTTFRNDPALPEIDWIHTMAWRVPVDDEHHTSYMVRLADVSEAVAERYRARLSENQARMADQSTTIEIGERVLRGELRMADIKGRPDMINLQDYVAQVGQGTIADRAHERLGRSDVGVILLRQIWARELQALAEGRALKQWQFPRGVFATTGV
jgi:5,5'-dehydrodivanillate O-demethylase